MIADVESFTGSAELADLWFAGKFDEALAVGRAALGNANNGIAYGNACLDIARTYQLLGNLERAQSFAIMAVWVHRDALHLSQINGDVGAAEIARRACEWSVLVSESVAFERD